MQLSDAVDEYLALNPRITSDQTGRRYHTTVNNFAGFLGRVPRATDLTPESYARWIHHRRGEVAGGTVRGEAEKLLVIWKWLHVRGLAGAPNVALPPKQGRVPDTFTDAELRRLWETARGCRWLIGTVPGSLFWPALLSVLYETSERISPVLASRWWQYDLERRYVTFPACDRKTPDDFVRSISPEACGHLQRIKAHTAGVGPFGERSPHTIRKRFDQLLDEAGVAGSRRKKFHGFRSRSASDIARGGGNAALHLGHADPRVTARHYLDPKVVQDRAPLALLYRWRRRWWWPLR